MDEKLKKRMTIGVLVVLAIGLAAMWYPSENDRTSSSSVAATRRVRNFDDRDTTSARRKRDKPRDKPSVESRTRTRSDRDDNKRRTKRRIKGTEKKQKIRPAA